MLSIKVLTETYAVLAVLATTHWNCVSIVVCLLVSSQVPIALSFSVSRWHMHWAEPL